MAREPQKELPLRDTEHILDFFELRGDEHIAQYPVGARVISEFAGLVTYRMG